MKLLDVNCKHKHQVASLAARDKLEEPERGKLVATPLDHELEKVEKRGRCMAELIALARIDEPLRAASLSKCEFLLKLVDGQPDLSVLSASQKADLLFRAINEAVKEARKQALQYAAKADLKPSAKGNLSGQIAAAGEWLGLTDPAAIAQKVGTAREKYQRDLATCKTIWQQRNINAAVWLERDVRTLRRLKETVWQALQVELEHRLLHFINDGTGFNQNSMSGIENSPASIEGRYRNLSKLEPAGRKEESISSVHEDQDVNSAGDEDATAEAGSLLPEQRVGAAMREAREAHGVSLRKLAKLLGYQSFTTLSAYERGVVMPTDSAVAGYERLLGLEPGSLVTVLEAARIERHGDDWAKHRVHVPVEFVPPEQRPAPLSAARRLRRPWRSV